MITSFGLVYLTESFGHFGLWFIMIPACIGYIWGVQHFDKLEREQNDYHPVKRASAEIALKRLQEEMAGSRYNPFAGGEEILPYSGKNVSSISCSNV